VAIRLPTAAHTLVAGTIFLGCVGLSFFSALAFAQSTTTIPQPRVASIGVRSPASVLPVQDPVRQASDALIQWRKDWENRDFERFSAHYSEAFQSGGIDRQTYLTRKRAIFERRPWQRIRLNEVLWIAEQANPDVLLVRFIQEYDSPLGGDRSRKEQRWIRVNQQWQLAVETEVILSESDSTRSRSRSGTGAIAK